MSSEDSNQFSGIVWSNFLRGFVRADVTRDGGASSSSSSSSSSDVLKNLSEVPRVDDFATLKEWEALCQLIGPQGLRCIEHSMYHLIAGHATTVRAFLSTNRAKLERIQQSTNDSSTIDSSSMVALSMELEMTSDVLRSSISMGHALKMRDLIREATRRVLSRRVPMLHSTVRAAFAQYPPNVSLDEKNVPLDRLARECGLDVGAADHELIRCVEHLRSDEDDDALWSLLPYAYGAVLTSKYWIADKRVSSCCCRSCCCVFLSVSDFLFFSPISLCVSFFHFCRVSSTCRILVQ
jgi:hypothetical protein